jgi:hypothetical protein
MIMRNTTTACFRLLYTMQELIYALYLQNNQHQKQ